MTLNCTYTAGEMVVLEESESLTWNCPDNGTFYCDVFTLGEENGTDVSFSSVVSTFDRANGTGALVSADAGEALCTTTPSGNATGLNDSIVITLTG